ncbi:MAG: hypothetical protein K6C12_06385 [Oscillospiraceae bacterium]|nr:hypothetical protein [Oscillospiraceae bacterium]
MPFQIVKAHIDKLDGIAHFRVALALCTQKPLVYLKVSFRLFAREKTGAHDDEHKINYEHKRPNADKHIAVKGLIDPYIRLNYTAQDESGGGKLDNGKAAEGHALLIAPLENAGDNEEQKDMYGSVNHPIRKRRIAPGKEADGFSVVNPEKVQQKLKGVSGKVFCHKNAGEPEKILRHAAFV